VEKFRRAVATIPHVVEAYRMSGDLDCMLKVRVADMRAYDRFYQKLIRAVPLADVSASFVMEEIKENRGVPLEAV
jgi:Lrp/AsnC family transcriptional regulator